ncbi:MAG TPA: hypothetical protein PLE55_09320 [Clostridiales bacterium]|nr:hypothetical protein [Clostridiales bacterium]
MNRSSVFRSAVAACVCLLILNALPACSPLPEPAQIPTNRAAGENMPQTTLPAGVTAATQPATVPTTDAPAQTGPAAETSTSAPAQKNAADFSNPGIIIGVEYASPGMAAKYSELGITGVKPYPSDFKWGVMQSGQCAKINFDTLDQFVAEYQNAGFRDIMLPLHPACGWANVNSVTNFTPKPKFTGHFEKWVSAVVERYDLDGNADMPGLRYPVNLVEIGVEFSSFEPEPAADYIKMLERAYKAAHAASKTVKILHSAFLAGSAFITDPGPGEYEAAFAAADKRIMYHSLADIRQVLDRPDIFDIVNFHALCYPGEIEQTVRWLKYEMGLRHYSKPVAVSDTSVNPFLGYGSALKTEGDAGQLAILSPPAKEEDRERLKAYFLRLINGDETAIAWVHTFCATDMVKKIFLSAHAGVLTINTAFMEEFAPSKSMLFGAAAGNSIWSGITLTSVKPFSNQRMIEEVRPAFYAIGQAASRLKNCTSVVKVDSGDENVLIYRLIGNGGFVYVAWYEPDILILPGDSVPGKNVAFTGLGEKAVIEEMIGTQGQTQPARSVLSAQNGSVTVRLTYVPQYIMPG